MTSPRTISDFSAGSELEKDKMGGGEITSPRTISDFSVGSELQKCKKRIRKRQNLRAF